MEHTPGTYVDDIFNVRFRGLRLVPSKAARIEMMRYGLMLENCLVMLENGKNAPRRRKRGTVERWIRKRGKVWNMVVKENYSTYEKEHVYLIVHVGCFRKEGPY